VANRQAPELLDPYLMPLVSLGRATYSYEITAIWTADGQERNEKKTVWLVPGKTVSVIFLK
jgi:hypothetical protein